TDRYVRERQKSESFQDFIKRIGKQQLRSMLEPLMVVPAYDTDSSFYSDWGDPREFTIGDIGMGECAGEVVSVVQFDLAAVERLFFEIPLCLEETNYVEADALAYRAMLQAALALVRNVFPDVVDSPDTIVSEFRTRFYETDLLGDRYAGSKFAQYL